MSQHYLFILTHPKPANAAYFLALIAAAFLPAGVKQTWLSVEESSEKQLLEHTLLASDVVLVSSLAVQHGYQQYFEQWLRWESRSDIPYRMWMQGKVLWAVLTGGENRAAAKGLLDEFSSLALSYAMHWGGSLWSAVKDPQAIVADIPANLLAQGLFKRPVCSSHLSFSPKTVHRQYSLACQCDN